MTDPKQALLYTTRNEADCIMKIVEGTLPTDLKGVFYMIYPVGSINSNGLPFPENNDDGTRNQEYGSPVMNGDGMALFLDFNHIHPVAKSRILKPPCYYADASLPYKKSLEQKISGFRNWGLSRISVWLGARNLLNTALIPIKFDNSNTALLAAYDVGRPFVMDPKSLELKSPLGYNTDWTPTTPSSLPWVFPIVMGSAHPTFDPLTQELFAVNFIRSMNSLLTQERVIFHMKNNLETFKQKLSALVNDLKGQNADPATVRTGINGFIDNIDTHMNHEVVAAPGTTPVDNTVYLMRWMGGNNIDKWQLKDQFGQDLAIKQCMHQTSLSEDYILLTDTSFKFTIDLLFNTIDPDIPGLDDLIRYAFTEPMLPYTVCYIVKRKDLVPGTSTATAYAINQNIPLETIHYSLNYKNPGGIITMYAAHNSASCVAEWMRPFDTDKLTGQPLDPEVISLFALGSMDVCRFGKWEIDAENLSIAASETFESEGNTQNLSNLGPNTWNVGFYTYRDMISADKNVDEIKYIWTTANGLDNRMLSTFIYDLYAQYTNRIVPIDDMLSLTEQGVQCSISRIVTSNMTADDYYQFEVNHYVRSIQFGPKAQATAGVDPQLDGYLMCSVLIKNVNNPNVGYRTEFWLFDATNIAQGPVCKLQHDDIHFCISLHTAWLPEAKPYNLNYSVDIRSDYDPLIKKLPFPDNLLVDAFFSDNVYPNYN